MGLFSNKVDKMSPGQVLADQSVGDFVASLGLSIATAQRALDENAMAMAIQMAQTTPDFSSKSLLELGLTPTFYQVVEAELEVKMTITMRIEEEIGVDLGLSAGSGKTSGTPSGGTGSTQDRFTILVAGAVAGDTLTIDIGGTPTAFEVGTTGTHPVPTGTETEVATGLSTAITTALTTVTATVDDKTVTVSTPTGATITSANTHFVVTKLGPDKVFTVTIAGATNGNSLTIDVAGQPAVFVLGTGGASGTHSVTKGANDTTAASGFKTTIDAQRPDLTTTVTNTVLTITVPDGGTVTTNASWDITNAVVSAAPPSTPSAPTAPAAPKPKKQAVAWGVSVNAHYHRRFEMEVSGSSRVTWKIVALPPPSQFMDEIQESLTEPDNA